jgi:hypothetical protein
VIDQEDFERIISGLKSELYNLPEDVEKLVISMMEMDKHLEIAQTALEFVLNTAEEMIEEFASSIVGMIGIRDAGKKRRIFGTAREFNERLAGAVQLFIARQIIEAQHAVSLSGDFDDEAEG